PFTARPCHPLPFSIAANVRSMFSSLSNSRCATPSRMTLRDAIEEDECTSRSARLLAQDETLTLHAQRSGCPRLRVGLPLLLSVGCPSRNPRKNEDALRRSLSLRHRSPSTTNPTHATDREQPKRQTARRWQSQ